MLPSGFPARGLRRDRIPAGINGMMGYYAFDAGTPIVEGTWDAALASAQSALTAAALVAEGERNAVGLFGELRARGYTGSRMTVERFLLGLRRMEQQGIEVSKTATSVQLTPRRAVGLMLSRSTDLTEEERVALGQVCQIHQEVKRLNALFQQFAQMLRDRRA